MRVHLDTDLGGDTDDACALAMLLGWSGTQIVGITTTTDPEGWRAAYVRYCLGLVDRTDIPVEAGTHVSIATGRAASPHIDGRYWPKGIKRVPSLADGATELLLTSIKQGATIVAIGPYTNLAVLEQTRPGSLRGVPVVLMGGWIEPPEQGLPAWGPEMDFNVQWDIEAAQLVEKTAPDMTLAALPPTLKAHLRAADLPRLRASGPLGALLARQGQLHAQDHGMAELARAHHALPDDLLNFHYDPVACGVALGWSGAAVEEMRLCCARSGGILRWFPDRSGREMRVLVDVDGAGFGEMWLQAVEAAQGPELRRPARTNT